MTMYSGGLTTPADHTQTAIYTLCDKWVWIDWEVFLTGPNRLIRKITHPLGPHAGPVLPEPPLGLSDIGFHTPNRISLTYDLRLTNLPFILSWLESNGLPLAHGFWTRLMFRWVTFKDENRRDQAAIVHQCCSVPPPKE